MSYEVTDFEVQVLQRSRSVPVLVDFWAPWCGPCRGLGPVLEHLAGQAQGRWELIKVNTEAHPDLATAFRIASIPAVKLFANGKVVDEFVGALPEPEIRRFLERTLPSPHAARIAQARQRLTEGSLAEAAQLLEPVLQAEPDHDEARVLLAQAFMTTAPERSLALLKTLGPKSGFAQAAQAVRTLARLALLARQPGGLPEARERDRYLTGAAAVRCGDYATALEALIGVLERDRNYDNGGAKEACKAIFQILGRRHPLAERYFRAFSSALHA
jgi:putative thioredoxin